MSDYIIIVAGGSGMRMNSGTPKQFLVLAGKPILMHTISRFHAANPALHIIVVLPANEIEEWKALCLKYNFNISHVIERGGATRFDSVKNGLTRIMDDGIVGIHDGVRPLVTTALIQKCFVDASLKGNAVPCLAISESIRIVHGDRNEVADRNSIVSIQTPQCFSTMSLKKAYLVEYNTAFTDDASVVEATGEKINLVEGEHENIKITFPSDLYLAEALLQKQK